MKKFHIYNVEYCPLWDNGSYTRLEHIGIKLNEPWILLTPDGTKFHEASQSDAIYRMNLIQMGDLT